MNSAVIIASLGALSAASLSIAAAIRAQRSASRWSFAAGMAILAAESLFLALSVATSTRSTALAWQQWRFAALSLVPPTWLLFSLSYAHAPGRQIIARNRGTLFAALLVPLAYATVHAPWFDSFGATPAVLDRLGWRDLGLHAAVVLGSVAVIMSLERTFRASVGTMRWRIKYMLFGVGVLFAVRIYVTSQVLVFRGTNPTLDILVPAGVLVAMPLIVRALLRAGKIDLDVYPSGSALRNTLTVLVAGVYLVTVGILAKIVTFFGGDSAFSIKALVVLVAVVALAIAVQSDRAQLHVRRFVSHHFQRPLHDYASIWRRFTEATTPCVQEADLCRSVSKLIADVFQALSVRLWLLDDKREALVLAATTADRPAGSTPTQFEADQVVAFFSTQAQPIDIEIRPESWCAQARAAHPSDFPEGGHRYAAPLAGRGELLGIVTVGDRVSGIPFSTQDLELLQSICDHAAASLLNVHLSQRLLQAKQLEAFQSMAAFFVHDLKNAASTLNLMLRNLPVHFDDPEFRADALRGIAKTVEHINALIGRLTALRHELKVEPVEADLNELVSQALAGLGDLPRSTLVKDIRPVPRIPIDREQVHKVITNLVLNAAESVTHDGRVRVSTGQENGWVVLTVDDNGCGMTEEFVSRSLFRPFQTTKKDGMGIGMFQSKMIVEAHGGRIAVSSRPGNGTRFQVFLRAPAPSR